MREEIEKTKENAVGVSFLCDMHGRIIRFLRDDIGLSGRMRPGQPFTMGFDTENIRKAFGFFSEIKEKGSGFGWELCVAAGEKFEVLHFAGYAEKDSIFIVGAKTRSEVIYFCDELMIINNEQANTVRQLMKQQISGTREQTEQEIRYYEELTNLNNELESTQRELERTNLQLTGANTLLNEQKQELERLNRELSETVKELERTRDELVQSEKMASLGRMVAGFAHEINTPIGIALTAASTLQDERESIRDLLSREEVEEDELVQHLETIHEAADLTVSNLRRSAELVSSFKRTSIDQTSETPRLFDVCDVIQDTVNSLSNAFRGTRIEIIKNCPEKINTYGYPGALSQVLANFMMNSLIHGFEDGEMLGNIIISAYVRNGQIHLDYEDSGKGMDETAVRNLFEPFFTTRRAKGGTGLGMYLSYNIIKSRLKGDIRCESAPATGTRFFITFPVEKIS